MTYEKVITPKTSKHIMKKKISKLAAKEHNFMKV